MNVDHSYNYKPVDDFDLQLSSPHLVFDVKISNDAILALTPRPGVYDDNSYYEVVIGGWANTVSAVKYSAFIPNLIASNSIT